MFHQHDKAQASPSKHYVLVVASRPRKRTTPTRETPAAAASQVRKFDQHRFHEEDMSKMNCDFPLALAGSRLHPALSPQGHGKVLVKWLGERPAWTENNRGSERLAVQEARRLGFRCVVLREGAHDRAYTYDPETGDRLPGLVQADWHLTLMMGWSTEAMFVQGHLYCTVARLAGEQSCPVQVMRRGQRTVLTDNDKRLGYTKATAPVSEFWGINGSCGSTLRST
ncbi:hypothetical protein P8C59_004431 [Phyllachora maydis]|uniref:Uncharacterized protein n=1 Tax=Phyllachora maydis TaxID=1825666 RepID=A0AAD9MBA4_9PEZI|nr:hypothetical protein P8C59_004431 [Phyllachora maydis]